MNITLNKNSWHFKIYSKIFSDTPPKSLCPYFWSMVCIVVILPVILPFSLGAYIGSKIPKRKEKPNKKLLNEMTNEEVEQELERMKKRMKSSERTGKIVLGVFLLFIVSFVVISSYLGIKKDGWFVFFRSIFAMVGVFTTTYWFIRGLVYVIPKITDFNVYKVPVAMIKSVYTKTCPIINWK